VFQDHLLLPHLSALENVLAPTLAAPASVDRKTLDDRARKLLDAVGLTGRLTHRPAELSGGSDRGGHRSRAGSRAWPRALRRTDG
jgi:predicted ABC-type transport system involved in lysophospholipase L1 biosynthesis ATPase subunit